MLTFLCYPKCTTCQKAKKWLDDRGISYRLRDIKLENPTAEELAQWHSRSGLPLRKFFLGKTAETEFFRFQVYRNKDTGKIEKSRKNGSSNNIRVRHIDIVRHKERRRTHNGRHNLTAG